MAASCFIAMPFRPELNYFFLYIARYLEEKHGVRAERGDARILTKPLMDKIREQILEADFLIGDVTGGNPNVFLELGLAQAYGKPIIFISQDAPEDAPVDIRQFEFIHYELQGHTDFLAKLDNAVQSVFLHRFAGLYERARVLLQRFNADTGFALGSTRPEEFQARVMRAEQAGGIPAENEDALMAEFLLPRIIDDTSDVALMRRVDAWLTEQFD
ncbi:MAG: hypothetical protein R3247_09180 [Rhodothermales bacterium]|nr:hypothetical protein [Rhodothermales bacterium]